jgi:hypothetical protein
MSEEGELFEKQQADVQKAFDTLRQSTSQKVDLIKTSGALLDEATMRNYRAELDRQIEALHLAVSNYIGDCDRRKQKIEAAIAERLDVSAFGRIGASLCTDNEEF